MSITEPILQQVREMSPDELQQRFTDEIEKRAVDDKYIDGNEERELLQIALQHGFPTDWARNFLVEVCRTRGYAIEAAVVQLVRERLRSATLSDGRIDWRGFKSVVAEAKLAVAGTSKTESEIRKLVVTTMEDTGLNRVKTGWLGNWYRKLKRDVGA